MPIELIRTIIDQAARYYPKTRLGYAFTEPLIYPHLMESLDYANEKKLHTAVTTNGLNLRRFADGLIQSGLNELFVSLDGPPEIHNYIRGNKRSFQKAMEGIEYLLDQPGAPEISVYCCITEWNIGHLKDFLLLFREKPLKKIGFMHTNYTPADLADHHNAKFGADYPATPSNMEEINLEAMDLDLLWTEIEEIKKMDLPFPAIFSPEIQTREALELFYYHPEILFGKKCNDAFSNIMIKSNGDIIPAHGRCYNIPIGNLYSNNLKQIWKSSELSKFRKTLNDAGGLLPACSRCCSAF